MEFAIVVPLLLLLVFGIIDFGRMASDHVQLSAAARAAAQALAAGTDPVRPANNVFKGGGSVSVRIDRQCSASPQVGDVAQVTVTYKFRFATPVAALAKLAKTPTMTVQAAAPCRA